MTGQTQKGLSPSPYNDRRENKSIDKRKVLSFFVGFQFRVVRLALLAVMSLQSKRYDMIAFAIYNLAKPIITMRKRFITDNLPVRAIIV